MKFSFIKELSPHLKGQSEENGISVSSSIRVEYNEKTESYICHFNSNIQNNGDERIMAVSFKTEFFNKDDECISTYNHDYHGISCPIYPGNSVSFEHGFQEKMGSRPVRISITITSIKNELEEPPVHLPQQGEYLYQCINDEYVNNILNNKPVEINVGLSMNISMAFQKTDDKEFIDRFVEEFVKVRFSGEAGVFMTDSSNGVYFTFADGHKAGFGMIRSAYEMRVHNREFLFQLADCEGMFMMMRSLFNFRR
ncbi:MAG: hypothetical protein IK151_04920 [Erysipelotrichaceae bacterium]|nr:hypothetical protein [Erysipelotrichaceae bacterium]